MAASDVGYLFRSHTMSIHSSELIRFTGALLAHHLAPQCKQFKPSCFGKPLPLLGGAEAQHLSQDLRQDLKFKLSDHKPRCRQTATVMRAVPHKASYWPLKFAGIHLVHGASYAGCLQALKCCCFSAKANGNCFFSGREIRRRISRKPCFGAAQNSAPPGSYRAPRA